MPATDRKLDCLGRIGGEEFFLIGNTDQQEATLVLERISISVAASSF